MSTSSRSRSVLVAASKFLIPIAIIAWLLWRMEPEKWQQLRDQPKDYPLLVGALVVALGAMALSYSRWWVLVRCQGISLNWVESFRLSAIGYLLSFASAGSVGGDLFKAFFLARRSPGKRVEAVASVVVDRGVGLLGLLVLVLGAIYWSQASNPTSEQTLAQISQASLWFAAIGFGVIACLILGGRPIDRAIQMVSRWRWVGGLVQRLAGPIRTFHHHPIAFFVALIMSIGVHVLLAISVTMVANSLYREPPSLKDHMVMVPVANLAAALPIAPGGMGVLEAAMAWLYEHVPSTPTLASGTVVMLVFEFVKLAMASIGMIFYWTAGREVQQSLAAAEET